VMNHAAHLATLRQEGTRQVAPHKPGYSGDNNH
jgi:hypothetical protein